MNSSPHKLSGGGLGINPIARYAETISSKSDEGGRGNSPSDSELNALLFDWDCWRFGSVSALSVVMLWVDFESRPRRLVKDLLTLLNMPLRED